MSDDQPDPPGPVARPDVVPEPQVHPGSVPGEVADELPGLTVAWTELAGTDGRSSRTVRRRLDQLADRFRGAQAVTLRTEPVAHAYRVLFRHVGLDPDETRTPIEALALDRLLIGRMPTSGRVADARTVALLESRGVPVWIADAASFAAPPGLELVEGRIWLADATGPVAPLFAELPADRLPTKTTEHLVLVAVVAPGVPDVFVEEALWAAADALEG